MTLLHPHWDATDGEAKPAREHVQSVKIVSAEVPEQKTMQTVSRRPAALIGIALVMGSSYLFVQGFDETTGQLSDTNAVEITAEGLLPESITVAPGQEIVWTNHHPLPQILESTDLCTPAGDCLSTTIMWENETTSYAVPLDIAPGTYTYFSSTDELLEGTIIVQGMEGAPALTEIEENTDGEIPEGMQTPEDYFDFLEETFGDGTTPLPTEEPTDPLPGFPEAEEEPDTTRVNPTAAGDDEELSFEIPEPDPLWEPLEETEPDDASDENLIAIPSNPYTVHTQALRPSAPSAQPTANVHTGAPPIGKGKPPNQPKTGNGVLLVTSLLSIGGLAFVVRRQGVGRRA